MKTKLLNALTAVILYLMPNVNFGQAPNLGTAANFVIFSTDGAVSNTGLSHLTGNVGTNNGSSTAFGNVNGGMHDGDGVSAQCASDLLIAYNQLNSTIPTFFPAPLLGGGQILYAGVYSISSAATLDLDLILDAQGNSSAVFIFKIEGAFSTNANAKVKLINGGLACNVFWKVEGAVDMAAGTTMRGTIIANNGAIEMSTNDTLEGRALSTTGAITIDGILAYTPIGCGSPLLVGPSAPALASSECYAIFSSNGPVVNAGITTILGDVGTNVGLTSGFSSPNVTGMIHPIPDPSTVQCAADLLLAYNYINGLSSDIELLYPQQFGNNLVLTPHTYIMNGAVIFTDTLYLNAQGNANAVFIIKTYGAFATSVGSQVMLTNGAQAKNVYWMINGAVSINNYSNFNGTLVCYGAIDILQGATINGRALTVDGALNANAANVTMTAGCATGAPDITTQPANKITCAGSSVSFSVIAHGDALTYQWRKGTVNLVNGGNISGATSAILTINPANLSDVATNYNVVVSGSLTPNQTSSNVSLTVNAVPSIITPPTNQMACVGSSVSFSVNATGTGLTYQWRKGTVNLVNGGNISGANSITLTINPSTLSNAATNYNVIITGVCGPISPSTSVSLVVNSAPLITEEPTDQTACVGTTVNFAITATGTGLVYQWRKGTTNLSNGGSISGVNLPTLTINPVDSADIASNYNVVITGTCSPISTSINASLSVCPATGIDNLNGGIVNEIAVIYPNPFTDQISIILNDALQINNCELKLYNVLGAEVLNSVVSKQVTTLETSNLPAGIYFYKIIDKNKTIQSGRLISQQ
ncbi:MAG: ice-binding family protein [Bacteroidota bacterium]